jgi:trigger factor
VEGCKYAVEVSVPADEVVAETGRVVSDVQKRAKLQGFRPGKVPASLVRQYYSSDIRQRVLDSLIPRHLEKIAQQDNLNIVSRPEISDVHLHEGEPLRFKASFEIAPAFELQEFRGLTVPYHDPEITEEDIARRLDELRAQKAQFVNLDPRPLADGDFAVLALESLNLPGEPLKNDEMVIEIGGAETMEAFTENLRGMSPGEEAEIEVEYPADYAQPRLAGNKVRFRVRVKGLRKKDIPELNDDFAQEAGDYRDLGELRDAVRRSLFGQRQYEAQTQAKNKLVDQLVDRHDFPVPEAFIERQIRSRLEQGVRGLAAQGIDASKLKLDWERLLEEERPRALREVKEDR